MKQIKKKKCSLRLDGRVLRNSKSYASQMGWHMGELIINALKRLYSSLEDDPQKDKAQKDKWVKYLPDGWSIKRKRKSTSVEISVLDEKFLTTIKKERHYSFEATVEIALMNYVPSLRKYGKEVLKPDTCLYKCTKCFREEERTIYNEKKVKCKYCKGRALPKNNTKDSYYNWMLKKLLEYIQFGSSKIPDISDIDAEIVKRFFVKKLKRAKKITEKSEKVSKEIFFTPIIDDIYPEWSNDNKAVVSFEDDGIYTGIVYRKSKGKVYIWYGDDWEEEDEENEEDYDKFPIRGRITEQGGRVLGELGVAV
jgi:DNA-directed RNA polymerase subunit RPC12/RpoP